MIKVIAKNEDITIIKHYPTKIWLAFISASLLIFTIYNYTLFQSPIYSSLTCTKNIFNNTNCELVESALLKDRLTHQYINNVSKPRKAGGRSNTIWLKTEARLWHGSIKNIYYPSNWFFDPTLQRSNKHVTEEISKLNNFIRSREKQTLTINREVSPLFSILVVIMLLPCFLPLISILICPITTYSFERSTNKLAIKEFIPLERKETVRLEKLDNVQLVTDREFILLKVKDREICNFNNFTSEEEYLELLELIKQHIHAIAEEKSGTNNNTQTSPLTNQKP